MRLIELLQSFCECRIGTFLKLIRHIHERGVVDVRSLRDELGVDYKYLKRYINKLAQLGLVHIRECGKYRLIIKTERLDMLLEKLQVVIN